MEGYDSNGDPLVKGIISGTATLTGVGDLSRTGKGLAREIQDAMAEAVLEAAAVGITDSDEVRAHMLEARKKVLSRQL